MYRYVLLTIWIFVVLESCKSQENTSNGNNDGDTMQLVLQGEQSGFGKEEVLKIDSRAQLEDFFSKVNSTRKPGIAVPDIDFNKKSIIIHVKGETTNGEPVMALGKVTDSTVVMHRKSANQNNTGTAIVSPFFIYTIPKTSKPIRIQ